MNDHDNTADAWPHDVAAAVAGSVLSALPIFLVAALAPQIRESLHFDVTRFGAIIALYYLSAALGSVPLSRGVEAIGATRAMRVGGALIALFLLLLSLLTHGLPSLACLVALAGLTSSAIQPATNLFLVRRIPSTHWGVAFGFKQAAIPLAVALSGLAVPVLGLTLGWRWTFAIMAVSALMVSILMPRARSSFAAYRARPPTPSLRQQDVIYLVVLAFGFALGVASASAMASFAVTALTAAGQGYAVAGVVASVGGLVTAITRTLVGLQFDRRSHTPFNVIVVMLGLGAAVYGVLAVATVVFKPLLIPALLLAFALGWGWNGLFNMAITMHYPDQAARATAITSVGGRTGGVLGPLLFGFIAGNASYAWAWLFAAFAAVAGTLVIFLGRGEVVQ